MHHLRLFPIVAVVAVLGLLASFAGCGGGDEDTGTTGVAESGATSASSGSGEGAGGGSSADGNVEAGTATKAAFVKNADAICARFGTRLRKEVEAALPKAGVAGADSPDVADRIVNEIIAPGLEAEIAEIRSLNQPADGGEEVEAVLEAIQSEIEGGKSDPPQFVSEGQPFTESLRLARKYGFKSCGGV